MALLKDCELWYARLVPDRPNKKYNRENPTWEVQIRTYDVKQKKEWEAQGVKLTAVVPEDGGKPYWKTMLKKNIFKKSGEPNDPIEIKAGNLTSKVDPATIGNGSRGNVQIWQREYTPAEGGLKIANTLSGVQLTRHKKYTPKPRDDDFEEAEMEVIEEEEELEESVSESESDDEEEEIEEVEVKVKPKPTISKPKPKFD